MRAFESHWARPESKLRSDCICYYRGCRIVDMNFVERCKMEVKLRRIYLLSTRVNRGIRKGWGCCAPALPYALWLGE